MVTTIDIAPSVEKTKLSTNLVKPTLFEFDHSIFEYSVYQPSIRFLRDFDTIFPSLNNKQKRQLLVVPVIQKCEFDMVGLSKEVNHERDIKLELVSDTIYFVWNKKKS